MALAESQPAAGQFFYIMPYQQPFYVPLNIMWSLKPIFWLKIVCKADLIFKISQILDHK